MSNKQDKTATTPTPTSSKKPETRQAKKKSNSDTDDSEEHPHSKTSTPTPTESEAKMQQHMQNMESTLKQYQSQLSLMMLRMEKMEQKSIQDASELQHTKDELEKARATPARVTTADTQTQEEIHGAVDALQKTATESQEVMKDAAQRLQADSDRITTIKQQATTAATQDHKHRTMRQTMMDSSSDSDEEESDNDDDDGPTVHTHTTSVSHRSDQLYRHTNLPKMPVKMSKFSGVNKEENVQNWVDEFHTLKVATGWRSKETIALAGLHLTQVARNWFNHIGYKYATWDAFSQALIKEYGRQYSPHLIRELVSQMPAQKENESCSEFLGRVRTRLNEYGVYEDKEIADAFLERMRPEWKQQVLGNIGDTRVSSMDILAIASKWEIAVKAASNARKSQAALSGLLGTNPVTEVTVHNELAISKDKKSCIYCKRSNHVVEDCRLLQRNQEKKNQSNDHDKERKEARERKKAEREKLKCTYCEKSGHEEKGCWKAHPELAPKKNVRVINADVKSEDAPQQELVQTVTRVEGIPMVCKEQHGTYVVHGRISNISIPMTIDIGADDTSCISQHAFMQLPISIRDTLSSSNRPLNNVDDSNIPHLGKVKVNIQFDPINCNVHESRQLQMTLYVVPNLSVACLLGSDFTEKYTKCIDVKQRKIELVTGDQVQMHVKSHHHGETQQVHDHGTHAVMLSKDITLEPYSAVITPHACALMPREHNMNGSVWLTEANASVLSDGVLVARTAQDLPTKVARGKTRVIVQLTNTTPNTITYKAGRRIGLIQEIDVMVAAEAEDKKNSQDRVTSIGKEIDEHMSQDDPNSAVQGTPYQQQMTDLLKEYAHLFDTRAPGAARMDGEVVEHSIETGGAYPIARPPRRQSPAMEAVIEKEVKNLLDAKIIRPSNSPWASNLVLVKKKDGTWRPCVDFRELNAVTDTDVYPIPAIDQLLYNMQGAKVFSCMDLQGAYHQIRIAEKDQKKTAFIFRGGLYEYIRMPFGLKNAPATFQRFMNMMLSTGGLRTFVMAYLDDLVVFSRNVEEHIEHVRQTLAVLSRHGVKLKLSKCQFGMQKIKYLGHVLDAEGVHVDTEYVKAVKEMAYPTNISELRTFLGMGGYYRSFIPSYAKVAQPLYDLLKKTSTWKWTETEKQAMDQIKQALVSAPVLVMPDYSKPFIIQTDGSAQGIGAVLCQQSKDDTTGEEVERPIAYVSRSLKPAETRYAATHLEMLAVIYGINKFRHYVAGTKFKLQTDHKALEGLMKSKDLQGRMARWVTSLQEYDFTLQYRKGSANANADTLSRLPMKHTVGAMHLHQHPIAPDAEEKEEKSDVKQQHVELEAEEFDGLDVKDIPRLQKEDPMWKDIYMYVTEQQHNETASQEEKEKLERECEQYLIKDEGLLFHIYLANGQPQTHNVILQLCLPRVLIPTIMKELHDEPYSGHRGTEGTYGKLVHRYWWKGMHRDTKEYCMSCVVCAKRKVAHRHGDIPMLSPQVDQVQEYGPMECIAIDGVGPLPTSGGNQQTSHWLTICDVNTRVGMAIPIRRETTENIAYQIVHRWIMLYGFPRCIISDNGPGFASAVMKRCMKLLDVKVKLILPYRPQSNGICERLNGTLKSMLGSYTQKTQKEWADLLPHIVFAYNTSVHNATGYTPYYLLYGREACIGSEIILRGERETRSLPEYIKNMHRNIALAQQHVANRVNATADERDRINDMMKHTVQYHIGDEVYIYLLPRSDAKNDVTRKLMSPYHGPYRVTKVINDVAYQVEHLETKKKKSVHVSKMKKVHKRPQHLMPPEDQPQIPILQGALDDINQQQGDQFQTHATRRQQQHHDEKDAKYDEAQHEQGTPDLFVPTSSSAIASEDASVADDEIDLAAWEQSDEDELEEGEVPMITKA
jgi:hypothetical protein